MLHATVALSTQFRPENQRSLGTVQAVRLHHDAADVSLDCGEFDDHEARDRLVAEALDEQPSALDLARGQVVINCQADYSLPRLGLNGGRWSMHITLMSTFRMRGIQLSVSTIGRSGHRFAA